MSAFEMLCRWPAGTLVYLTGDGCEPLKGVVVGQPHSAIVVVSVPGGEFEFNEQSDIEIESTGRIHVH